MKQTDDVFQLIKSLSKSEKRVFKLSASHTEGNKNYLKLFDAMDSQKEFNESILKEKLKGEKFITNIAYEKNYLKNSILKTLRNASSTDFILQPILLQVCEAEVLYAKGFSELALKKIQEAQKTTLHYEYFGICLDLLNFERRILLQSNQARMLERFPAWEKEFNLVLEKQNNLALFININTRMHIQMRSSGVNLNEKDKKEYKILFTTGVMSSIKNAKSSMAGMYFYQHLMAYFLFIGKEKDGLKYSSLLLNHLLDNSTIIEKFPQNYITVLSNHIIFLTKNKKFKEAYIYLEKLESFPEPFSISLNPLIEEQKFQKVVNHRLDIIEGSNDFSNLAKEIDSIKKKLAKRKMAMNDYYLLILHHLFGVLFFSAKKYKEALQEFYIVIENKNAELAKDYKMSAKILILLTHFEKKNDEMLPYLVKNLKLTNEKGIEKLIIDFITKKLIDVNSQKEQNKVFNDFKTIYSSHPEFKKTQNNFNLLGWIEDKIKGV